jgi:hypothetical protein
MVNLHRRGIDYVLALHLHLEPRACRVAMDRDQHHARQQVRNIHRIEVAPRRQPIGRMDRQNIADEFRQAWRLHFCKIAMPRGSAGESHIDNPRYPLGHATLARSRFPCANLQSADKRL